MAKYIITIGNEIERVNSDEENLSDTLTQYYNVNKK